MIKGSAKTSSGKDNVFVNPKGAASKLGPKPKPKPKGQANPFVGKKTK